MPHSLDLYVKVDSAVHRLDPRAKLVAACGFILAVLLAPVCPSWPLGLLCLLLGGTAALARLPLRMVLLRLLPVSLIVGVPFALCRLGGTSTRLAGELFAAKSLLIAAASLALTATTPVATLLETASRVPGLAALGPLAQFIVRSAGLLMAEVIRTNRARVLRAPAAPLRIQLLGLTWGSISLLVRAAVRSERVGAAMALRGFQGAFPLSPFPPLPRLHLIAGAAYALTAVGIAGVGRWL